MGPDYCRTAQQHCTNGPLDGNLRSRVFDSVREWLRRNALASARLYAKLLRPARSFLLVCLLWTAFIAGFLPGQSLARPVSQILLLLLFSVFPTVQMLYSLRAAIELLVKQKSQELRRGILARRAREAAAAGQAGNGASPLAPPAAASESLRAPGNEESRKER